jgi:hypothetical protein
MPVFFCAASKRKRCENRDVPWIGQIISKDRQDFPVNFEPLQMLPMMKHSSAFQNNRSPYDRPIQGACDVFEGTCPLPIAISIGLHQYVISNLPWSVIPVLNHRKKKERRN